MFGSILKYSAVALAGVVAFTTAGFFMDSDVIESARAEVEVYVAGITSSDPSIINEQARTFISVNRGRWIKELTFARSVEDLDAALAIWL